MAHENITWDEERIANELRMKHGFSVSPRTVRKYMPRNSNQPEPRGDQRLIGTLRRECLDYVIPLSERHLRRIMTLWVAHYNCSSPHSALGSDIPSRLAKPSENSMLIPRIIMSADLRWSQLSAMNRQ